jgi:hypothetical protein
LDNKKYEAFATFLLLLTITATFAIIHIAYSQGKRIYLNPSENIFYTNETRVGDHFNVTVWIEGFTENIGGAQIHLEFDGGLINVTRWWAPYWDPNFFMPSPYNTLPEPPTPYYGVNYVEVAVSKGGLPPTAPWGHDGIICIFEFEIKALPPRDGEVSCPLHINNTNTFVINQESSEIETNKEDGSYKFVYTTPPKPYLAVGPNFIQFRPYENVEGKTFNVTLLVKDVDALFNLRNVSISLSYDQTILATEESNLTLNSLWSGPNEVIVSDGKLNITVTNPSTIPIGDVPLGIIMFTILQQDESPPKELGYYVDTSLNFVYTVLFNTTNGQIAQGSPQNGLVRIYAYRTTKAQLTITLPVTEIDVGMAFSVNVTIDEVFDLKQIQIKITYDKNVINCTDVNLGADLQGYVDPKIPKVINQAAGYLTASATLMSPPPLISGVIFEISFKGLEIGTSSLNFSRIETDTFAIDSLGNSIPLDYVERSVNIVPEFPPVYALTLFLILTLIAVAFHKKAFVKPN